MQTQQPSLKSMKIHYESKHPKIDWSSVEPFYAEQFGEILAEVRAPADGKSKKTKNRKGETDAAEAAPVKKKTKEELEKEAKKAKKAAKKAEAAKLASLMAASGLEDKKKKVVGQN